jgi:alkyldihydroxyacetonephosphate synthase
VSFDVVAFAAARAGAPGPPRLEEPAPPPAGGDLLTVDEESLTVTVAPGLGAAPLETALRELGLTLGLFPEDFERATVGQLVAEDAPGAGASGPGFASRLVGVPVEGQLTLGVRRRPVAQAGRGLAVDVFADGIELLRRLAQDGDLPEIALVADAAAADLWLSAAGDPDETRARIPAAGGLLVLIAAGPEGVAARRIGRAVRDCLPGPVDLGQNPARGWAGVRYEGPRHAEVLARAGYDLDVERRRLAWRELAPAAAEARGGGWVACEVSGATLHDALLTVRRLTSTRAAGANPLT